MLETARSVHLAPFKALRDLVEHQAIIAADNLHLLAPLEAPCQALAVANPRVCLLLTACPVALADVWITCYEHEAHWLGHDMFAAEDSQYQC